MNLRVFVKVSDITLEVTLKFQHHLQPPWSSNRAFSYRVGTLLQGWHASTRLTFAAAEPELSLL